MSEYEIEDDYPIPAVAAPRGRREKYQWSALEIGQSFFVPDGDAKVIRSAASKARLRNNKSYMVRAVEGGVRVWRHA